MILRVSRGLTILQPMRAFLVSMLLGLCIGADAAVYKIVNPDGSVTFSDRPQEGAEELDVGTVQTIDADVPSASTEPVKVPAFPGYEIFEISSPKNDETFRDNGGVVSIQLTLQPRLFRDHTISIFMDGKDIGGGGRSTGLTLQNVDRGSHRVHATVVGKDGEQVASTPAVTFHLHRTSVIPPP